MLRVSLSPLASRLQYKPSRWWFEFALLYNKIFFVLLTVLLDSEERALYASEEVQNLEAREASLKEALDVAERGMAAAEKERADALAERYGRRWLLSGVGAKARREAMHKEIDGIQASIEKAGTDLAEANAARDAAQEDLDYLLLQKRNDGVAKELGHEPGSKWALLAAEVVGLEQHQRRDRSVPWAKLSEQRQMQQLGRERQSSLVVGSWV